MSSAIEYEWFVMYVLRIEGALAARGNTKHSLNPELAQDVSSGFFGREHTDNCRTGGAFNGENHLDKTSPPRQAPVINDPAWLLNFVCLKKRVAVQN